MKKLFSLALMLVCTISFIGCFGSDSKDSTPPAPASYVTLKGTLIAPDKIESSLLGNTLSNLDSEVRGRYRTAGVSVNGIQISSFEILDIPSNVAWPIKIENVAESSAGTYELAVVVGRITLRTKIRDIEKEAFNINLETTAAAMLADVSKFEQHELLASYPAFVNTLKNVLATSAQKTATNMTAGSIVNDADVQEAVKIQRDHLQSIVELTTTAKIAYLQRENDLNGDGKIDLYVKPNTSGQRVSFYTPLSSDTSILENVTNLDSYTDVALLADFADSAKLSKERTFEPGVPQTVLGLYFKKSASGDQYLKMYIHRIDLADGDFAGVLIEYDLVSTATTAISKGQKTLMLTGELLAGDAVYATDFLSDAGEPAGMLSFISATKGLGSSNDQRIVYAFDARPDINELSAAPEWLNGGNYDFNTADANSRMFKSELKQGDAFAAYFPNKKHYALFKINSIAVDRIVIDYIVNASEDERRFK